MPFGSVNAPTIFQMVMNMVLRGFTWKHIIVLSDNFENHLQHLNLVIGPLRLANLSLKPRKCAFQKSEVTYLGHIISKEGIKVDPAKIEAVKSFPLNHNQHDVRSCFWDWQIII